MGYDLRMVQTPASADEQELPNSSGIPGYYRFNGWGMRMTLGVLEWAAASRYAKPPERPAFPPAGFTVEAMEAAILALRNPPPPDPPPTEAELAAAREYLRAHEQAVSGSSLLDGRIATYKFESNEGWLVTPAECLELAKKLRAHAEVIARDFFTDAGLTEDDGRRWVLGFARYNEIAAEHGGYRVH